jgi:hypothetical protein
MDGSLLVKRKKIEWSGKENQQKNYIESVMVSSEQ